MDNPGRVRVNRVDLWRNIVKSKISKIEGRQTMGQTNLTYGSTIPFNTTTSVLQTNPLNVQPDQYQSRFVPSTQPVKNAYSFNYQKPVQVWMLTTW